MIFLCKVYASLKYCWRTYAIKLFVFHFSFKLDRKDTSIWRLILMYAHVVVCYPIRCRNRHIFRFKFYKNVPQFLFYASTIQLFYARSSLPSESDITLQIGLPRANFISACEFLFYFRSADELSAIKIYLFLFFLVFIFFAEHPTCIIQTQWRDWFN